MRTFCLFFVAAWSCIAQWTVTTWIRSDALKPAGAELSKLLRGICPGDANASACQVCPRSPGGRWEVSAVYLGHFLSPASEDALVSTMGCESHADDFGGSHLLSKAGSSWREIRYVAGMIAGDCRKLSGADGRDRLVCGNEDAWQGHSFLTLYILDPAHDGPAGGFFSLEDTTGAAEPEVRSASIDRVDFLPMAEKPQVRIVVYASLGKVSVAATLLARETEIVKPATVRRRYDFIFDGAKISPAPGNPSTEPPQTSYSLAK